MFTFRTSPRDFDSCQNALFQTIHDQSTATYVIKTTDYIVLNVLLLIKSNTYLLLESFLRFIEYHLH